MTVLFKSGANSRGGFWSAVLRQVAPPNLDWWKQYPIYQIYPRSFQDSDGDGTGDLAGITQRLDYLHWLGIKIVWVPLVLLTVLAALNVEIIQFVTTLGVGSLAVALALKDTLANVFSGIQLVVDQPIRAGDFVEVDTETRGVVHDFLLRIYRNRAPAIECPKLSKNFSLAFQACLLRM